MARLEMIYKENEVKPGMDVNLKWREHELWICKENSGWIRIRPNLHEMLALAKALILEIFNGV